MIDGVVTAGVSYYQDPVDDSYPRPWLFHRAFDGGFTDPLATTNNERAISLCERGRMTGHTAYGVYEPGVDMVQRFKNILGSQPDPYFTAEIDVERWGGKITGDHSPDINRQAEGLANWLGDQRRVIIYANGSDYDTLFPHPDHWLRLEVAAYGSVMPQHRAMIAWQYTNGNATTNYPVPAGMPVASSPFGRCCHTVFPGLSAAELADAMGVGKEANMPLTEQDINKIVMAIVHHPLDSQKNTVAEYIRQTHSHAADADKHSTDAAQALNARGGVVDRVTTLQTQVKALEALVKAVPGVANLTDLPGKVADAVVGKIKGLTFKAGE